MRLIIFILCLILTGCFWHIDEEYYVQNLTKDFNINMVNHTRTANLSVNEDSKFGGKEVVSETITEIWYNDNYIVLKWSPNLLPEIKKGLYVDTIYRHGPLYQIKDKRFLDYLPKGTNVKTINGKLYHNSLNMSRPDSLYPYKKIKKYYIIDHSKYKNGWINKLLNSSSKEYNIYRFNSKEDFRDKLKKLGILDEVKLEKIKTTR